MEGKIIPDTLKESHQITMINNNFNPKKTIIINDIGFDSNNLR